MQHFAHVFSAEDVTLRPLTLIEIEFCRRVMAHIQLVHLESIIIEVEVKIWREF